MVYTVTCNPALDCTVSVDTLTLGALNRTRSSVLTPGGRFVLPINKSQESILI